MDDGDRSSWFIDSNHRLTGVKFGSQINGRISTGQEWDNYRLEVDVTNDSGVDEGIGFRRTDDNNTYEINLRHGPPTGPYHTPEIILRRSQQGIVTQLFDTQAIPLASSQTYHLSIETFQTHLQMWIDGILVYDLDDPNTQIKSGGIALSYWTGTVGSSIVRFDNVKVTAISKQLYPVIFIPGIGGSEMQLDWAINWSADSGHRNTYAHSYLTNETVWFNQDQALFPGNDDYFDILRLKSDGQTPEQNFHLTGNMLPYSYGAIDQFFTQPDIGLIKNQSYFVFNYDWRKDISLTSEELDNLVEKAKQLSHQPQVNIVAHSMGGLVARNYVASPSYAAKVNKLIELGTPHLGSVDALESLIYGKSLNYTPPYLSIPLSVVSGREVHDLAQNMPSFFELLPTSNYDEFYDNSSPNKLYPFFDDRDLDQNKVTGPLNFSQIRQLLVNLGKNMTVFETAQSFNAKTNPSLLKPDPSQVKLFEIIGSGQPTLGQIKDTWLVKWPLQLIPKQESIYVNGDDTVPLYSAALKSDQKDLSNNAEIFYVNQHHSDLTSFDGEGMSFVKAILQEGNVSPGIPGELSGTQLTVDGATLDLFDSFGNHSGPTNDVVENNIPEVSYKINAGEVEAFVKSRAPVVTARISTPEPNTTNLKVRHYLQNQISQTSIYQNLPTQSPPSISLIIDPTASSLPELQVNDNAVSPTSIVNAENSYDLTPPQTQVQLSGNLNSDNTYSSPVLIALAANDQESGLNQISYSLDNGQTNQIYAQPFQISNLGTTKLIVSSTDNAGNQEFPQTINLTITNPIQTNPTLQIENKILVTTPLSSPFPNLSPRPTPTVSPIISKQKSSLSSSPIAQVLGNSKVSPPARSFKTITTNFRVWVILISCGLALILVLLSHRF